EGFEFHHPEACQVVAQPGSVEVGNRIELLTMDAGGLTLTQYVDQQLGRLVASNDWELEARQAETVGGRPAISIDYRFGGTRRFGSALFLERAGKVYIWNFTAGGFSCDEPDVYREVFASFQFTG